MKHLKRVKSLDLVLDAGGGKGLYHKSGGQKTATELAYAEVISYNKKNLDRELQNESRQQKRGRSTRVNLEID